LSEQFQSHIETQEHFRQCALIVFLLDFGTVPTVWHYWFFYWSLELFRQCGIIGFSIELWNCSNHVALFQSPIEKQLMHTVGNVPMSNRETNNATLSEQLHSPI
jgi:hypothetical protein